MLHFLQMEGKTLHQQKDYGSLYCGSLELNPQCLRGMLVFKYLAFLKIMHLVLLQI